MNCLLLQQMIRWRYNNIYDDDVVVDDDDDDEQIFLHRDVKLPTLPGQLLSISINAF